MIPFFPKKEYDSAYEIPYEKLYAEGIRGIVFDIDNTLVLPDAPSDLRSRELFRRLHETGFRKPALFPITAKSAWRRLPMRWILLYVCKAGKAFRKGFLKALGLMEDGKKKYGFRGRPAFYGYLGFQQGRHNAVPRKAHDKEGRNPDHTETDSGKTVSFFYITVPGRKTDDNRKIKGMRTDSKSDRTQPVPASSEHDFGKDGRGHGLCSAFRWKRI
jgi:hypothetical protein